MVIHLITKLRLPLSLRELAGLALSTHRESTTRSLIVVPRRCQALVQTRNACKVENISASFLVFFFWVELTVAVVVLLHVKVTAYGLRCLIHEYRLARWLNFAVHQRILLWTDICMLELSPTLRYFLTFVLDLQLGRRNWLNITQIHSLWRLISRLHADREFVSIDIYLCMYIYI